MVPTTGLEPIKRVFSPLPTLASFSVFIAHTVTAVFNDCKHYLCIFGKSREENLVQFMCKKSGCANFVQTKLAPESVQTLCKDFGPPWRVAGLWRVRAITRGSWQRPGLFSAQTPWGWKGASIRGWAGVGGFGHAIFIQRRQRTAGVQDACKLAR
jgi:hypothetical protein